jgi:hypothetical protein
VQSAAQPEAAEHNDDVADLAAEKSFDLVAEKSFAELLLERREKAEATGNLIDLMRSTDEDAADAVKEVKEEDPTADRKGGGQGGAGAAAAAGE